MSKELWSWSFRILGSVANAMEPVRNPAPVLTSTVTCLTARLSRYFPA